MPPRSLHRTRPSSLLCAALLLSLCACGGEDGEGGGAASDAGGGADGGPQNGAEIVDGLDIPTEAGTVTGATSGTVRRFLGIPFAAPPTGELRWRPPRPVESSSGARDATEAGAVCPQTDVVSRQLDGDEDCLYLNVWTPDPAPAAPLPVMVWIHGGAFVFGSGSDEHYAGDPLVERGDVILVSLNYRLGALGFLAHEELSASDESGASGNYGLMDQRAALEWVQRNIAAFGGDADNVTIFGESAGGRSVCWHLVSEASAGLFHRAIVQSGICMKPTHTRAGAEAQGARYAEALGCTEEGAQLGCLRGKTPGELIEAVSDPEPLPGGLFYQEAATALGFEPTIDGTTITGQPLELFSGNGVADVPVLHGANTDEGILFHVAVLGNVRPVTTEEEYEAALARRFGEQAADIMARYPAADHPSPNDALVEVTADAFFVCPARQQARLLESAGRENYLYHFGGLLTGVPIPDLQGKAFHSGELPFVFGNPYPLGSVPPEAEPLSEAMQDYFLSFARSGDPSAPDAPSPWPSYTAAADELLVLDDEIALVSGLEAELCDFWEGIELPPRP